MSCLTLMLHCLHARREKVKAHARLKNSSVNQSITLLPCRTYFYLSTIPFSSTLSCLLILLSCHTQGALTESVVKVHPSITTQQQFTLCVHHLPAPGPLARLSFYLLISRSLRFCKYTSFCICICLYVHIGIYFVI